MHLRRLTLENFRQFRGKHEILFAGDTDKGTANITVIYGENGRGKTGVFRALMFCLYGDRRLSQDDESAKDEIVLVNLHALRDHDGGASPTAYVEAEFGHRGSRYTLRRNLRAILHGNSVHEEVTDISLSKQLATGNCTTYGDPDSIRREMTEILDPRVREYFLFDGERIERLTRATPEQRREVSQGIRNLLNIDDLETSISVAKKLCRDLDTEIRAKSTGEHARTIKQINELEDKLGVWRTRTEELDAETRTARAELHKVDRELEKYQEITELIQSRHTLTTRLEELTEQMKGVLMQMRGRCAKAAVPMIESTLRKVFEVVDSRKRRGELPPEIRHELIAKILHEDRCICGRPIDADPEARAHILRWKERSEDPGVSDSALEMWRDLHTVLARFEDERPTTEAMLQRYADLRHDSRDIEHRLEQIAHEIGDSEREDAAKLEKHRQHIEEDLVRFEAERQNIAGSAAAAQQELEVLRARRTQLEGEISIRDELVRRSRLSTRIQQSLEGVHEAFRQEIVSALGD